MSETISELIFTNRSKRYRLFARLISDMYTKDPYGPDHLGRPPKEDLDEIVDWATTGVEGDVEEGEEDDDNDRDSWRTSLKVGDAFSDAYNDIYVVAEIIDKKRLVRVRRQASTDVDTTFWDAAYVLYRAREHTS